MTRLFIIVRDAAGLLGGVLIAGGIGMMHAPSGVIAAGVLLLAGALVTARAT